MRKENLKITTKSQHCVIKAVMVLDPKKPCSVFFPKIEDLGKIWKECLPGDEKRELA